MSTRTTRPRMSVAGRRLISFSKWRLTPVLVAALAMGLVSCDDDEDNPSGDRDSTVFDGGGDALPDMARPDMARPDMVLPDMSADLGADMTADLGPDMAADLGPDAGECSVAADCVDDGNACTTTDCIDNRCVDELIPECCTRDLDCGPPGCIESLGVCAQRSNGAILISEVMLNPVNGGQWIEIHNAGATDVRINDWSLVQGEGEGAARHTIATGDPAQNMILPAGGYVVLASSADAVAPVTPIYVYSDFAIRADAALSLVDAADGLASTVSARVLQALSPLAQGASISRSADRLADPTDDPMAWCPGDAAWSDGTDLGSPGAANAVCPPRAEAVDLCRLQFPLDAEAFAGTEVTIFGRVREAFVTDLTDGTDANASLLAEVGYGPDGSDPAADATWSWTAATANAGWNATTAGEPGVDEYQATVVVPAAGTYDHAYRFSADNGLSWTYCDRNAGDGSDGSQDGYQAANAGSLLSLASPCTETSCLTAPPAICRENAVVGFEATGTCNPIDGETFDCTYAEIAPVACENGDICDAGVCRAPGPFPAAGEVFITELMYDPHTPLDDNNAEWVEIYNGADTALDLTGCLLQSQNAAGTLAGGALTGTIAPGAYFLVGRNANAALNGGLTFDSVVPSISLGNNGSAVILSCQDVEIDRVAYSTAEPWPPGGANGARYRSLSLDPAQFSAETNDLGNHWCLGSADYLVDADPARNHKGTPGAANTACPVVDVTVDFCRLQFPLDLEAPAATSITVFGRVFEAGITDASAATDDTVDLLAQAGYGPDASDPAANGEWVWFDAAGNPAWIDTDEPGNDEYQGTFNVPVPGSYDLAYRFSRDGGSTWLYCDRDAGEGSDGSENGYQVENAGALLSVASPCEGVVCNAPPADVCAEAGETLLAFDAVGACEVVGDAAECRYVERNVDCAADGGTCEVDACVYPVCEPNPCNTPPVADCADGSSRRTYAAVGTCADVNGAASCDYAAEIIACPEGETCTAGVCAGDGPRAPAVGEVFITELMYDPHTPLNDATAEYIELYNGSEQILDLTNCLLQNQSGAANPVGGPLTGEVAPGAYFLVGRSADLAVNGGIAVDSVVGNINLGNSGTAVILTCAGVEVDRVAYTDAAPWPIDAQFRSISLDRGQFNATANNDGANWCYGRGVYFQGAAPANDSRGTPGAENPPCDEAVDFCRLQFPLSINAEPGVTVVVYGRLYEAGVTDRGPTVQSFQGIRGELGYGPDGSAPAGNVDWTWQAGVANAAWDGAAAGVPDEDEYQSSLVVPAQGRYDYAWRFTVDAGRTWTYCDGGAEGSTNGYQPENAGDLTSGVVVVDPCMGFACDSPPAADCADVDNRRTYANPGVCSVVNDAATCVYAPSVEPCGAGFTCDAGACVAVVDPCAVNPCLAPPDDDCVDLDTRRSYMVPGNCTVVAGNAQCDYAPIPEDCPANSVCVLGSCEPIIDPCLGFSCNTPPPADCANATTRRTYNPVGACANNGGNPTCTYAPNPQPCNGTDICTAGVCAPPPPRGPAAEEVFFSEIMYRPKGEVLAANGEWFELFNRTVEPLSLNGCTVFIAGIASPVANGLVIPARGYLLFARSANAAVNGGLNPAGTFNVALPDNGAGMQLVCPAGTIDTIQYATAAPWPVLATGNSVSLNPANLTALGNNTAANWCYGRTLYYDRPGITNDLRGTPGTANPNCSESVDFCRLQAPLALAGAPGTQALVYGRIREAGLTNISTATDPQQFIQMQFGYGPDASSPVNNNAAWTWFTGTANVAYDGTAAGEPDNDEYQYRFTLPAVGRYDFAWRATVDGGRTWAYCDGGAAGSTNGYQTGSAGDLQVTVVVDPCTPNPCNVPPAADCADGDTRQTYAPVGTCTANQGAASCNYAPTPVDCAANETCSEGACVPVVDPCDGVVCDAPPANSCVNPSTRRTYFNPGECSDDDLDGEGNCSYTFSDLPCAANEMCMGGVCQPIPDPCAGVVCNTPPADSCVDGTTQRTYGQAGQCNDDDMDGVGSCDYQPIDVPCAQGDVCTGGVCLPDVGACDGVTCNTPPADRCQDASTRVTYMNPGVCEDVDMDGVGTCDYAAMPTPCGANETCQAGACQPIPDPCAGVACNTPPVDTCQDPATRVTYMNPGQCSDVGGVGTCNYAPMPVACGANETCSEGTCQPNPDPCAGVVCTPPAPTDCTDDVSVQIFENGRCEVAGGVGECVFDEASMACPQGEFCEAGVCAPPATRAPLLGEMVINEIMYNPAAPIDEAPVATNGEFVELYNRSNAILVLTGCRLNVTGSNGNAIGADKTVQPGGYFLIARSANAAVYGGVTPDHVGSWGGIGNGGSTVTFECVGGAGLIDQVIYTTGAAQAFPPGAQKHTIALDPAQLAEPNPAALNDVGGNWCYGRNRYFVDPNDSTNDHRGTPKAANPPCTKAADFCRLQFPEDHTGAPGSQVTVYGRLYEADLTDVSPATDVRQFATAQVGIGPNGSDPAGAGWTWTNAVANPNWNSQNANAGDEDEYQAVLTVPAAQGDYDFAYRFSVDGRRSFTYCDTGAGSSDGYNPDDAGQLTAFMPDPCAGIVCDMPPAAACANETTRRTFANPGVCNAGTCTYAPSDMACDAGFACNAGVCELIEPFTTAEVEALFRRNAAGTANCTGCHTNGASSGGWNFDAGLIPTAVDVPSVRGALDRIEPGDRQSSFMFRKLAGTHANVGGGSRMPLSGIFFTGVELERIGLWIDGMTECGSGVLTANKECDDGNVANADGCDSACTVEVQRIVNGAVNQPSSIGPGAVDIFEFAADGPSLLNAKVLDAQGQGACLPNVEITVYAIDGGGNRVLVSSDDAANGCAELAVVNLPAAGEYEIEVSGSQGQAIPAYVLEYALGRQMPAPGLYTASFEAGGSDFFVVFNFGAPVNATFETSTGANQCNIDTFMTLFQGDPNGRIVAQLAADDNSGLNNCSRITRALGIGVFLVNVRGSGPAANYRLSYTLN